MSHYYNSIVFNFSPIVVVRRRGSVTAQILLNAVGVTTVNHRYVSIISIFDNNVLLISFLNTAVFASEIEIFSNKFHIRARVTYVNEVRISLA